MRPFFSFFIEARLKQQQRKCHDKALKPVEMSCAKLIAAAETVLAVAHGRDGARTNNKMGEYAGKE
jgi:hypothetical protein